jgi:hypothetical protein
VAEKDALGPKERCCTVLLEPCDGIPSKTRLKALLRDRTGLHVLTRVFDSLDDAFLFAQSLYREAA